MSSKLVSKEKSDMRDLKIYPKEFKEEEKDYRKGIKSRRGCGKGDEHGKRSIN